MAIERVSLAGLKQYLASVEVTRGIREVVLHHTWRPTAREYQGEATWTAIRRYHMTQRGWSDIGYHFGIGPEGSIWKLRPVTRAGAHVLNRNEHTIGVVLVGDFDVEDPVVNGLAVAGQVVGVLLSHFRLGREAIRFHREFQNKTCPGRRLALESFRDLVLGSPAGPAGRGPAQAVKVVDVATGAVVETLEVAPGGNHVADQGKVYVVSPPASPHP